MKTTVEYTDHNGKLVTRSFTSRETLVDALDSEVKRLEIMRMITNDREEVRRMLNTEMTLLNIMSVHLSDDNVISNCFTDDIGETPEKKHYI